MADIDDSYVKPVLRSKVTTKKIPAKTIEEEKWECTCGMEFRDFENARFHYGENHAADRSIEIRDCTFYLISTQSNFDCWRAYQQSCFNNHRMTTNHEWTGPGWYCLQIENYGRHSGSVWDGEQHIITAESVVREWQIELGVLEDEIERAKSSMSMGKK